MKNFFLTFICCSLMSLGMSQVDQKVTKDMNEVTMKKNAVTMKKNVVKVSDFLAKELKLDKKTKSICLNAYAEYAQGVSLMLKRMSNEDKDKSLSSKNATMVLMKLAKKRDIKIEGVLSKEKFKKYVVLLKHINQSDLSFVKTQKK